MVQISRRGLLKTGAAAGVLAASGLPVRAQSRGGTLRMGLKGANTSDSFDGRTHSDSFMINMGHGCVFDCLTEIAADGSLKGELAESWEASTDAKTWETVFTAPTSPEEKDVTWDTAFAVFGKVNAVAK